MTRRIDNDTDNATMPETTYQGEGKPVSSKGTSLSSWGLAVAVLFLVGLAVFAFTRNGAHTDPAPNGEAGNNGAAVHSAPAQNSQ